MLQERTQALKEQRRRNREAFEYYVMGRRDALAGRKENPPPWCDDEERDWYSLGYLEAD